MSLVIRNLQRVIPIRRAPLRSKIEIVRRILGVQKFDLGIICVDNKNIQHINRIYRGRNVPTDVLSFPFHEHLKAGEFPLPEFPDDYNLGDIFLGVEYIFHQCKEDEDYNDVLTMTATHGLCHLLGFTHSTEAEWQQKLDLRPALGKMTQMLAFNTGLPRYFQLNVFTKKSGLCARPRATADTSKWCLVKNVQSARD
ncbi:endoribonuclease YbeY isoform X3 [Macaca mulatta]